MPATPRSTVTLPMPRITQLAAIAEKRGLPNIPSLIEAFIAEAIERGEIPSSTPGFMAMLDDDVMLVEIAGHQLPAIKPDRARLLAAALSAVSGETDPNLPFEMPAGRPLVLDLGPVTVAIGRVGSGVRFVVKDKGAPDAEGAMLAASQTFIAGLAREIRAELTPSAGA